LNLAIVNRFNVTKY